MTYGELENELVNGEDTAGAARKDLRSTSTTPLLSSVDIVEQKLIIVWNDNSNTECTPDKEEHKTPDKRGECSSHQLSWVLRFSRCHGDKLGSDHTVSMLLAYNIDIVVQEAYVKEPWIMQDTTPRKRPVLPGARCSTKAP